MHTIPVQPAGRALCLRQSERLMVLYARRWDAIRFVIGTYDVERTIIKSAPSKRISLLPTRRAGRGQGTRKAKRAHVLHQKICD